MPLLDRTGWKQDEYVRYDEFFAAPAIIVPLTVLDAALAERKDGQRIGVEIANSFHPAGLAGPQDALDLIAIGFPKFNDGRGFSIARLLREQGFTGTLRAVGHVVPDEFAFALYCGFDEVEISEEQAARQPIEQWQRNADPIHVGYQAREHGGPTIFERRKAAREAA